MRILVFSASVGAGHLRAAQAVELALRKLRPDADVRNVDVLALTNAAFRRVYGKAYLDLVNRAPHLLGYLYDLADKPSSSGKGRRDRFRLAFERLNLAKLADLLCGDGPDLVINTHFLPAEILAALRREGKCDVPQVTVTTDFEVHRLWVNEPCEHYFTATEEGAIGLASWGVPREKITPTGIPIHPVFAEPADRAAVRASLELAGVRPVILQLAGGFGVGPIEKIYRSLLDVARPIDLVAVTGRNAEAKETLSRIEVPPRHRARVLGFTDQIDRWMAAADLLVSKPGGLTTSEALARGLPLCIVDPIPGQETRNADHLLENAAAIKVNQLAVLSHKVEKLLTDGPRLEALRSNARKLGRPRAAFEVVERALRFARETRKPL